MEGSTTASTEPKMEVGTKVTYERFAEVADALLAEGKLPSVLNIRGLLKQVNITNVEVSGYIKHWKKQRLAMADSSEKRQLIEALQVEHDIAQKTDELEHSLALVRSTLEATTDGIMMVDKEGKLVDCNRNFIEMWGLPDDLLESGDEQQALAYALQQLDDPEGFYNIICETYKDLEESSKIHEISFKDGRVYEVYSQPHRVNGHIVGRVWSNRNITERRRSEEALQIRNLAIAASPNGVVIINVEKESMQVIYANAAYERILKCSLSEVISQRWHLLNEMELNEEALSKVVTAIAEGQETRVEIKKLQQDGSISWVELYIAPVPVAQGIISYYVGILVNITEHKILEQQLIHQATHDDLTNLPNRVMLSQYLPQTFTVARRLKKMVALLFIDLDEFKLVNDTLGHDIGDILLRKVGEHLRECVRESDVVVRWGGDEFIIVLPYLNREDDVFPVINKIITHFQKPIKLQEDLDKMALSTASIGVSFFPKDGTSMSALLKNADMAMYKAKELGRNKIQVFNASMNQQLNRRVELEQDLRLALLNNEFIINLQPVVQLARRKIIGFEALIRWAHPTKGMVSPLEFIPVAEETDLIVPIGTWVIKTACEIYKDWCTRGLGHISISVNISARQIKQPDFLVTVKKIIQEAGVDPNFLIFEMTESILISDVDRVANLLRSLQELGIELSIDDFGTGYSSLSYLKQFPINKLKIDRSFVKDIVTDESNAAITEAIIAIARSLKMLVTAEGVEDEKQLAVLERMKCDEIQGFYFSKPVSIDEATVMLERQEQNQTIFPSAQRPVS